MTDRTLLITGGCGFIGTALIARLRAERPGARIRVYDSLLTGTEADLARAAPFVRATPGVDPPGGETALICGDIRDSALLSTAARGADAIVHLAASTGVGPSVDDPRYDLDCNVIGVFNALEAARANGVARFVFASSGAPAGEVEPPIHEDLPPKPVSPYGASKLAGEGYCSAYARTFGVGAVALRFGNVYGPNSLHKQSVIAKFIKRALAGEPCEIYGDGGQTRDFIFIDDLVDAILRALDSTVAGEIFQIASGRERTIGEAAREIAEQLAAEGVHMEIRRGDRRPGDVARNFSDTSKAERVLGWSPRTDFPEGVRRTIAYFMALRPDEIRTE